MFHGANFMIPMNKILKLAQLEIYCDTAFLMSKGHVSRTEEFYPIGEV